MRWGVIAKMIGLFVLLVLLWPNLVHEPLHLLALKLQGSDGNIVFGMHPYIIRTEPLVNIWWGLFYVLLPSIVSVAIVVFLLHSTWGKTRDVYLHFVLPIYLLFDLVVNVTSYESSISDFRFLQYFSGVFPTVIVIAALSLGCAVLWHSLEELTVATAESGG